MIIPWEWDDGFSQVFSVDRIYGFYRPMLRQARKDVDLLIHIDTHKEDTPGFILAPPYFFGSVPQDPELKKVLVQMIYSSQALENRQWQEVDFAAQMFTKAPGFATLSCDTCRQFMIDEQTGQLRTSLSGDLLPQKFDPPCDRQPCIKGHYTSPREPSELAKKAWTHYWMMKAARVTLECPIAARNAATIEWNINGRAAELNPFPGRATRGVSGDSFGDAVPRPAASRAGVGESSGVPGRDVCGVAGAAAEHEATGEATGGSDTAAATDPDVGGGSDSAVQCATPDDGGTGSDTASGSDGVRPAPGGSGSGDSSVQSEDTGAIAAGGDPPAV